MTISELAKIALDERRVVRVSQLGYGDVSFDLQPGVRTVMRDDQGYIRSGVVFTTEDLAADDWYEVKE